MLSEAKARGKLNGKENLSSSLSPLSRRRGYFPEGYN